MIPTQPTTTAAAALERTIAVQHALNYVGILQLFAYLNPYSGCVQNNSNYDFIVIGGGTAGGVIANRLSEDPHVSVLVIEAGGNFNLENGVPGLLLYTGNKRYSWNYQAEYDTNFAQCHRNKVYSPIVAQILGGTSSTDYMIYTQGTADDYDSWATITNESSWKFKNVQKLFKKIERFDDDILKNSPDRRYHGFEGNVGLTVDRREALNKYFKAFSQVGYKIIPNRNNNNRLGYSPSIYFIDQSIRQSTTYAYMYPVRNRTNLVVLKHAQATKILFDKNKRAVGVDVVLLDSKRTFTFAASKEIIVTTGTFNTPKLLQLSGIGPKEVLDPLHIPLICDLPVGTNYQNHVASIAAYAVEQTCRGFIPEQHNPNVFPVPTFEGFVALNKSQSYPDYRSVHFTVGYTPAEILLSYTSFIYDYTNDVIDYWYKKLLGRELMFAVIEGLHPKSRGTIHIKSANPHDPPIFKPGFYSNNEDLDNIVSYLKDYFRIGESDYFKKVGAFFINPAQSKCGIFEPDSDEYWKCYATCLMTPVNHHSGTAAMGLVVDGRLRVYGVKGLRVADASIMPTVVSGSITVPTMMIGENAAKMIKEDYNIF